LPSGDPVQFHQIGAAARAGGTNLMKLHRIT